LAIQRGEKKFSTKKAGWDSCEGERRGGMDASGCTSQEKRPADYPIRKRKRSTRKHEEKRVHEKKKKEDALLPNLREKTKKQAPLCRPTPLTKKFSATTSQKRPSSPGRKSSLFLREKKGNRNSCLYKGLTARNRGQGKKKHAKITCSSCGRTNPIDILRKKRLLSGGGRPGRKDKKRKSDRQLLG